LPYALDRSERAAEREPAAAPIPGYPGRDADAVLRFARHVLVRDDGGVDGDRSEDADRADVDQSGVHGATPVLVEQALAHAADGAHQRDDERSRPESEARTHLPPMAVHRMHDRRGEDVARESDADQRAIRR